MSKIVIALGGNALQTKNSPPTAQAQLEVVKTTCDHIAQLSAKGYELAIVHGNGPQVGRILMASETARDVVPVMPFDVCGAMSQGYIGYHIQQALRYALACRNKNIPVVSLVTQVVVERNDPAFQNPSKPIGTFYTKEEAEKLSSAMGYQMMEDAGRGYRRVVGFPHAPPHCGDRPGQAAVGPQHRHHLRRRRRAGGGEPGRNPGRGGRGH